MSKCTFNLHLCNLDEEVKDEYHMDLDFNQKFIKSQQLWEFLVLELTSASNLAAKQCQ